jgi:GNAT superfamily N-acetyltransferase
MSNESNLVLSPPDALANDWVCVREAEETDVEKIRDIYLATYGQDYAFPDYYDVRHLKKMVFADDTVLLVAEDNRSGQILGTASVLLDVGAFGDLVGEFGRLAVHPEGRHRGIGNLLMESRLAQVHHRLHVGLADNRMTHPFSQKISLSHGFKPVGFMPLKLLLKNRESVVLFARHFNESLSLRRNHPRIIPEALPIAGIALANCSLDADAIVDDESAPYLHCNDYEVSELTTQGYTTLLRFQRGRVSHREIFGPVRLHYGLFKVHATHSTYLLAKRGEKVMGAIGFTTDPVEKAVRVIELVTADEQSIRFLLGDLLERCRSQWDVAYVEVDVSAYAPRMQRTLLELGFLPAAYVPAMVFHAVERLDALKMVRLLVPFQTEEVNVVDAARPVVDSVRQMFSSQSVEPRVVVAAGSLGLFHQLNDEQGQQVARISKIATFLPGEIIFERAQHDGMTHVVLKGKVDVTLGETNQHVGSIVAGECLGEMSLLCSGPHSATATAIIPTETAVIAQADLERLIRQRPDIGVILYRNLAVGIGEKLWRKDRSSAKATKT